MELLQQPGLSIGANIRDRPCSYEDQARNFTIKKGKYFKGDISVQCELAFRTKKQEHVQRRQLEKPLNVIDRESQEKETQKNDMNSCVNRRTQC